MGIQSQYQNQFTSTADTTRTPSAGLWHQVDADMARRGTWIEYWEDFLHVPIAAEPTTEAGWIGTNYKLFSSDGSFLPVQVEGGVGELVEATSNEAVSIGGMNTNYRIDEGQGEFIFEARVQIPDITAASSCFVGMMDNTSKTDIIPITATGVTSDHNMVGFFKGEADILGEFATTYTANGVTMVQVKADAFTVVNATWVKLGMHFKRGGADNILRYFVNGAELPDTKTVPAADGTDFPNDVRLLWVIAVAGAAGTGQAQVDWIRVAQKSIDEA